MNSLLRITIEIAVKQAQELANLVKTVDGLGAKGKKSASGLKAVADAVKETAKGSKAVQEAQKKILDNQKAIDSASKKIIGNMRDVVEQFKRNMMSAEEAAKRIDELSNKRRRGPKGQFMKAQPVVVAASRKALDDIEKITQQKIRAEESRKIDSIKRVLAMEETGRMRSFAARRAVSKLSEGAAPGSSIDIAKARAYRTLDARESSRISKQQRDDQQRLNSAINSMTLQMSKTMEEFRNGLIDSEAASRRIKAIWQTPNADPALQGKIAEAGTVGRQAKINLAKIESAKIKAIKKEEIDYLNGLYKQYVNGQISYDKMAMSSRFKAIQSDLQPESKAVLEENIRKASISRLKAFTAEAASIESRYNQKKIGFNEAQAQLARVSEGIEKTYSANVTLEAKARTRTLDAINSIHLKNEKSHLDKLKKEEIDYLNGLYKQYSSGQMSYDKMAISSRFKAINSDLQPESKAALEENIRKASISRLKAFTAEAASIESRYNQKKIGFNEAQAQLARVSEGIENTYSANVTLQAKARTRTLDAINSIHLKNEKSYLDQLKSIENDYVKGKLSYIKALSAAGAVKGATPYASVKDAANQTMLSLTATREVKLHQEATSQIEDLRRKHYGRLISYADAHQEINKIVKGYLGDQASAQKVADDAAIARLKMRNIEEERLVRQHMEEIRLIRMRAATGMVTMDDAKSKLSAIGGMHAPGSKVNVQAASEIKRIADAEKAAANATDLLNGSASRQKRSIADLGKNMMWTGRQLEYTFTLPVVRAGKAIYELQKSSAEATTRIAKVYGDATGAANSFNQEQYRLGKSMKEVGDAQRTESYKIGQGFRLLSDGMGVQIDKVEEIGAKWAAAGYQGGALLKATQMTMEAMKVGDIESVDDTFDALIQTQKGYGLSLEQTTRALAILNQTENITEANFTDLTKGFARAGASASLAGVKIEELAGMVAVLTPAAGTAETVGSGLKTLIDRIMSPTSAFKEMLAEVGIQFDETFSNMTATQRLTLLAQGYNKLDDATRKYLETSYAGRYQINKASLLLRDLGLAADDATRSQSTFAKVVDASAGAMDGAGNSMQTYNDEIFAMLTSTPGQVDRVKTKIQNLANDIFNQMLPIILKVLTLIEWVVKWINSLSDRSKNILVLGIAFLAVLGPISRVIGAFFQIGELFKIVGKGIGFLVGPILSATGSMLGLTAAETTATGAATTLAAAQTEAAVAGTAAGMGPVLAYAALAAAIIAVIALIWVFRDDIYKALKPMIDWVMKAFSAVGKFIVKVFNALPGPVKSSLEALFGFVKSAVMAIVKMLSHLNPFQRHSPSLVDNVTAGVTEIARQYARLSNIGNIYSEAAAKLREFGKATESIRQGAIGTERNKQREQIGSQHPELMPSVESLWVSMDELSTAMEATKIEIEAQAKVVAGLEAEYKRLGRALDAEQFKLKKLEEVSSSLREQLDAAKNELSDWASRPIQGSKQLSDALFENEMAQKRLRLEMMKIEDTFGNIDEIKNKMALLAGEIEQLQALETDLRRSGAGSEITDPIEQKIAQLRAESAALAGNGGGSQQLAALGEQLKKLQREAERLDLEGALQFDPLRRQIEDLAKATEEATFEQIIAGMSAARVKIDELTPRFNAAEDAAKSQRDVVQILQVAHDDLGQTLDVEKGKLDDLQAAYDGLKSLYDDINSSIESLIGNLNDAADAAGAANSALDGVSGDWEDPVTKTFEDIDLDKMINEIKTKFMDGLEQIFKPFKDKWKAFKDSVTGVFDEISGAFDVMKRKILGGVLPKDGNGLLGSADVLEHYAEQETIVGEFVSRTRKKVEEMWDGITDEWDKNGLSGLGKFIGDKVDEAVKEIDKLSDKFVNWVEESWPKAKTKLDEWSGKFGYWITSTAIPWLIKQGVEFQAAFLGFLDPQKEDGLAAKLGGWLGSFSKWVLTDGIPLMFKVAADLTTALVFAVAGLAGLAASMGHSLINGMILGLYQGASYLAKAFADILRSIFPDWAVSGIENLFGRKIGEVVGGFQYLIPDPTYGTSSTSLHTGGIVPGVVGSEVSTVLQAGEGVLSIKMMRLIDKAIAQPEQSMTSNSSSGKTINFYGDLSFPNITGPDEAEQFIRNLEAMAAS